MRMVILVFPLPAFAGSFEVPRYVTGISIAPLLRRSNARIESSARNDCRVASMIMADVICLNTNSACGECNDRRDSALRDASERYLLRGRTARGGCRDDDGCCAVDGGLR